MKDLTATNSYHGDDELQKEQVLKSVEKLMKGRLKGKVKILNDRMRLEVI